jgi:glutathione S-transferase
VSPKGAEKDRGKSERDPAALDAEDQHHTTDKLREDRGVGERTGKEWLTFISSEIHKGFGPLWSPATPEEARAATVEKLNQRFAYLDRHLAEQSFLLREGFAAADAYLFTVTSWAALLKVDLSSFGNLKAYLCPSPTREDAHGAGPPVRS